LVGHRYRDQHARKHVPLKFDRYIGSDPKNADLKRKAYTAAAVKMARVAYGLVKANTDYRRFYDAAVPSGRTPSPGPKSSDHRSLAKRHGDYSVPANIPIATLAPRTQLQAMIAINAMNALMIDHGALASQHQCQPAAAESASLGCDRA